MASKSAGTLASLFRTCYGEYPALFFTFCMTAAGSTLMGIKLIKGETPEDRMHKDKYTIIRPEEVDPKLKEYNVYN